MLTSKSVAELTYADPIGHFPDFVGFIELLIRQVLVLFQCANGAPTTRVVEHFRKIEKRTSSCCRTHAYTAKGSDGLFNLLSNSNCTWDKTLMPLKPTTNEASGFSPDPVGTAIEARANPWP